MYHQISEEIFNPKFFSNKIEKLGARDVHLWGLTGSVCNVQKNYSDYFLDDDEQSRAMKFRFRKDHDLYVIGRHFTKIMLAYYTDCTPDSVKITEGSFGKPSCEMNLFFNISHSGDHLLLGFSNLDIGVDIERIDPSVDIKRIGKRHFSKIEFQKMMSCAEDERVKSFFEIWTKKEAFIKGIGEGLSVPLKDFNVTSPNGKVLWELSPEKNYGNWYVHDIESNQGFKSAFATQSELVDISYYRHD